MKKIPRLSLLFITSFLAACSTSVGNLKIDINNDNQSNSISASSSAAPEYFDGDTIEVDKLTSINVSFNTSGNYEQDSITVDELKSIILDDKQVIKEYLKLTYVGIHESGLKLGTINKNEDGVFSFKVVEGYLIKAIKIEATPRVSTVYKESEIIVTADEVSLSVNGSKYIKLGRTFDEDGNLPTTECNYLLTETDTITITSNNQRAIIKDIILYV